MRPILWYKSSKWNLRLNFFTVLYGIEDKTKEEKRKKNHTHKHTPSIYRTLDI